MAETIEAELDQQGLKTASAYPDDLRSALQRLDRRLQQAVEAAQAIYGATAAFDRFRGLHIDHDEVERLLARAPGVPFLHADDQESDSSPSMSSGETYRLAWLEQVYGLSSFEMDVLLIALAPEIDLRYERVYAYLQDDVARRRPSVDMALSLLCASADEKIARRVHFAGDAPLLQHNLIRLIPDPVQIDPPLLAHHLKIDEQIVRFVLEQSGLDSRLAPFARIIRPAIAIEELLLDAGLKQALSNFAARSRETGRPATLYFHGPRDAGQRRTAEALAYQLDAPLLMVDLARVLSARADFDRMLKLVFREAWFQSAVLYLDGLDELRPHEHAHFYEGLLDRLAERTGITLLAGTQPWMPAGRVPLGVITVPFTLPGFTARRACWQNELMLAQVAIDDRDLDALTDRFQLTAGQIADSVATAGNQAHWRASARSPGEMTFPPTVDDLFAAARTQSGYDLVALAHCIEPLYTWDDIVLTDDSEAQLREICQRVAQRQRVMSEWGFDRKLSVGKGIAALFVGPSGTGKTMAAEVIAHELGLDLYKIDLSRVVSKYVGETEKNLDRIFTAAENANAILFFDEADALFGKRSEVRDSHDRYANIEISYLLQKMEQYEGIAILATNLSNNMDDAFVRRLAFTVPFPFPEEEDRLRIWEGAWPSKTPRVADLDLQFMAQQFQFAGGNIKNIIVAAAFLAAGNGCVVNMAHLIHATRREFQKMHKAVTDAEFGKYCELLDEIKD